MTVRHVLMIICKDGWMPGNLSAGWRRLGCCVREFFYGTHMGRNWGPAGLRENGTLNRSLLDTARRLKAEGRLDLIFACVYDDILAVETAKELRALGVPMVNYHVDLVGQWYRVLQTGRYFDLLACSQLDHWEGLRRAGVRPYYLPMAANPPFAAEDEGEDSRFSFDGVRYLGSPWEYRCRVLAGLTRQGIPLQIYGHNWLRTRPDPADAKPPGKNLHDLRFYLLPRLREEGWQGISSSLRKRFVKGWTGGGGIDPDHIRGAYAGEEFAPLVRCCAINLGFTHFQGRPGTRFERRQVRLREFEIPLAGGFYLTQDCPQLRELFRVGEQVEVWNDAAELKEKIDYFRARPDLRRSIARAGKEHCLRHHTWEHRFLALLRELKLAPPKNR